MSLNISVVQSNPRVADVRGNAQKIVEIIKNLRKKTHLVVSSELFLCGYPPRDLLLSPSFLEVCHAELSKIDALYQQFFQRGDPLPPALLGAPECVVKNGQRVLYNAAFFFSARGLQKTIRKICLPHYDVFDEKRYFLAGDADAVLSGHHCIEIPFFAREEDALNNIVSQARLGVFICEDTWGPWLRSNQNKDQSLTQEMSTNFSDFPDFSPKNRENGSIPQIVINLSASPFALKKKKRRYDAADAFLRHCGDSSWGAPSFFLCVNQIGANDGLVFDGGSFLASKNARGFDVRHSLPFFEEECGFFSFRYKDCSDKDFHDSFFHQMMVYEGYKKHGGIVKNDFGDNKNTKDAFWAKIWAKKLKNSQINKNQTSTNHSKSAKNKTAGGAEGVESLVQALQLGIRDYVTKGGFSSVMIGLSGGIDSALTAVLAVMAVGAKNVFTLGMPSQYSSPSSIADSQELANRLGVSYEIFSIESSLKHFHREWQEHHLRKNRQKNGQKAEERQKLEGVAAENIQARLRGLLLMSMSNVRGHLILSTGNKSEIAVGYCTLYGDTNGALAVLGDCFKTQVYAMARHINDALGDIIPQNIIDKAPAAELRWGQKDSDTLPPYDVLDEILQLMVVQKWSAQQIIKSGFDEKTVYLVQKLVRQSEYKRHQLPPVICIGAESFGLGRKMPITF